MSKSICNQIIGGFVLALIATPGLAGTPAKFLGATTCASSGCHGGGGAGQNQFLIWSLRDFHSQRPPATLANARSKQIGEALGIDDPATDTRCTTCHAPLDSVPADRCGADFKISEGVSCESCHGPAENWLRAHTRTDYTRADRVAAGLRDLQNLYVRANTCVACHQVVSAPLLKAGHPELIFELDGQSVSEPKHWSSEKNGNGAQAWLVGQAVALREMSWALAQDSAPMEKEINRWKGLVWLVTRSVENQSAFPAAPDINYRPEPDNFQAVQKWADNVAQTAANIVWSDQLSESDLAALAKTSADFTGGVPQPVAARRAERLVLGLDRLVANLPAYKDNEPVQSALNALFKLAQSVPDFDPAAFAAALDKFNQALNSK